MKRLFTLISALLFSSSLIFAQEADMKVGELLNTSDWFELERVYPAIAANVLASNFYRLQNLVKIPP